MRSRCAASFRAATRKQMRRFTRIESLLRRCQPPLLSSSGPSGRCVEPQVRLLISLDRVAFAPPDIEGRKCLNPRGVRVDPSVTNDPRRPRQLIPR